jgi:Brp/Blh family beta-carotene 15,15'-monooxygenase
MAASASIADETVRGTGALGSSVSVPRLFWPAALVWAWIGLSGPQLDSDLVTVGALLVMLLGGLPHGAYDLAIGNRMLALDPRRASILLLAYIGVALAMAGLWAIVPVVALVVFLLSAALHFGEDWSMLNTGLLRATGGASVIAIPAIFHREEVSQLFMLMCGPQGEHVARVAVASGPVAILVMLTALARAYVEGSRQWALAQATAFVGLAVLPPQLGFTLFFVFLHSPLHMREVRRGLPDWSTARLAGYGAAICAAALLGGAMLVDNLLAERPDWALASGFQVLSILAAPHLVLHWFIDRTRTAPRQ